MYCILKGIKQGLTIILLFLVQKDALTSNVQSSEVMNKCHFCFLVEKYLSFNPVNPYKLLNVLACFLANIIPVFQF